MRSTLSVSDIERLAKAGVKLDIGEVQPEADLLRCQQPSPVSTLAEAVWERWLRTKRAAQPHHLQAFTDDAHLMPFELLASRHGEKVWLSVHPTNFKYEPFQLQDNALIFPSDALMASLALWEQDHK